MRFAAHCSFALTAAVAAVIAAAAFWWPLPHWWANSDMFYPVALYRDAVLGEHPLRGWWLTPSPYFITDIGLYFFCHALTGDAAWAFALYRLFVAIGLLAIIGVAAQSAAVPLPPNCNFAPKSSRLPLASGLAMSSGMVAAWLAAARMSPPDVGIFVLMPGYHGGAVLLGMAAIVISYAALWHVRWKAVAALLLLTAVAGAFSDPVFVPQFALPIFIIVAISLLRGGRHRRGRCAVVLLALSLGLMSGTFTDDVLNLLGLSRSIVPLQSMFDVDTARRQAGVTALIHALGEQPWLAGAGVASCLGSLGYLVRKLFVRGLVRLPALTHFALAGVLTPICTLAAPILLDRAALPQVERYVLPFFLMPLLILPVWMTSWPRRLFASSAQSGTSDSRDERPITLIQAVGAIFLIAACGWRPGERPTLPYPEAVAALDQLAQERRLRFGAGGYWVARQATTLSRSGLRLYALEPRGSFEPWIVNAASYLLAPNASAPPRLEFVITTGLDLPAITDRYGLPREIVQAGNSTVWMYDRTEDVAFRNSCRIAAMLAAGWPVPPTVRSPACLNEYKPNGSAWDCTGSARLEPGESLRIEVVDGIVGDVLEISADANDAYAVEIVGERGGIERLLPAMPSLAGLQARFIQLPQDFLGQVRAVQVRGAAGDGRYGVGHVFIYPDASRFPPPDPPQRAAAKAHTAGDPRH